LNCCQLPAEDQIMMMAKLVDQEYVDGRNKLKNDTNDEDEDTLCDMNGGC